MTGLVSASGRQFSDWSADYRLFSKERFDAGGLFEVARREVQKESPRGAPLVAAMDDTILRKRGTKTAGVAWRRDPLGPPFHTNFVLAQRFLQLSAALPGGAGPGPARMVPIDLRHVPTAKRPRRGSSPEAFDHYRKEQKEANISLKGAAALGDLRNSLDEDPTGAGRRLWAVVDGRFTNAAVLKNLPCRTVLIGRVRKDTKLYLPPDERGAGPRGGRRRLYGDRVPTPEELRSDESIPWQMVKVFAAGKEHDFRVKTLAPLKWRSAGGNLDLRLIVIAPLAYRPRKGSRLLYRQPAYLICTDPDIPLGELLQAYVWRWDIEVNFRDEKHLLGVGQAQVRNEASVEKVPQLIVAAYALMLCAAAKTFGSAGVPDTLPPPKWRRDQKPKRASTQSLISHLRAELWGKALGLDSFSGFRSRQFADTKPKKLLPDLPSAVFYAAA
ncbi:MAG: transposase [Thermodesulfobacteriota bacterium]